MKRRWLVLIALLVATASSLGTPGVAYATNPPSSTPDVLQFNAYRNVLETGDFLLIVEENTPYTGTPDIDYSEAFIWRLKSTDGTTEYSQALGYTLAGFNNNGWGYNTVSFYLNSANVTALMGAGYWEQPYQVTLSATPAAYANPSPYTYSFTLNPSDYSSLTDTDEVKTEIGQRVLEIAATLDNQWGVTATYSLIFAGETGDVLSIYGQAFFRKAIYGIQSIAPGIFDIAIGDINTESRIWTTTYVTNLEAQYAGTYIESALTEGESFFDVSYNLFGIILVLIVIGFIVFGEWMISGGNLYKGLSDSAGPLIIGARLALVPFGEFGLIVALCWLYISAKTWKLI